MSNLQTPAVDTLWTFYKDYGYRIVGNPSEYRYYIKKYGCTDETQSDRAYELVSTANTEARKAIDIMSAVIPPELPSIPEPEVTKKRARKTKP